MSYFYQGLGQPIGHAQIIRNLNGRIKTGLAGTAFRHPQHLRMQPRKTTSQWVAMGNYTPGRPN